MSGTQAREGTGLGLTISRQFVQLMGGDIAVDSTLGQGSTFSFDVQVTLTDAVEVEPSRTIGRVVGLAANQPIYRILVVDDRPENRDLITQLLETVGFEVYTANDGQEAIAQWQQYQPHLIWMDIRMPNMDGYDATRSIRSAEAQQPDESRHTTKIIALTASAFEEQRATILSAGCDDFVRKPFKEQAIFLKMAEHLGVEYIYASQDEVHSDQKNQIQSSAPQLTPSDLQVMSDKWIAALQRGAIAGNTNHIQILIEQIPEIHQDLAKGLEYLVNQNDFDSILQLIQEN